MANFSTSTLALIVFFVLFLRSGSGICSNSTPPPPKGSSPNKNPNKFADVDYLALALNLEYLETDFFLCAAKGYDLSQVEPKLTGGGPKPKGCTKVLFHLDWVANIAEQFAYQEIGHLKAIKNKISGMGFPRVQLDISRSLFANIIDTALDTKLNPPFDVYENDFNFLIGSYILPYVGLTAYVGAAGNLDDPAYKTLVAGLLAVESGQDAVIRAIMFQYEDYKIDASGITIANVTASISALRNALGGTGTKDEGIEVEPSEGAEGKIGGNVLAGDKNSVGYARTPREVLNIVYSKTGANSGGFFPNGANGNIAKSFRK